MGGGSIQLTAWGAQNKYLMGNPAMTFFKKVYKTHSNFAMESISVNLNRTDINIFEPTTLKVKIPRNGDLISNIYFVFELPSIISDSFTRFRWLENIGEALFTNVQISIGNVIVDKQSGEYYNIINNLSLPSFRREMYNKMIGNITALTDPFKEQVLDRVFQDNKLRVTKIYPSQNTAENPTLPAHKCFVPLKFWFNNDIGSALPIVALPFMDIEITLELRPMFELYQLFYYPPGSQVGEYRAPDINNPAHHIKNYINNTYVRTLREDTLIDIKARLEVNYVYLDKTERQHFINKPLEYLIEQCTRIDVYKLGVHNIIDIKLHNCIKELYWVVRRSDVNVRNTWFDFLDNAKHIMTGAKLMFNGIDRIEEKEPQYFNYMIPFQHHIGDPKEGIYCYTFAVHPDKGIEQPSGSCNFSRIDKFQFVINLKDPSNESYGYDLLFFASGYNILRIAGGIASLFYSL